LLLLATLRINIVVNGAVQILIVVLAIGLLPIFAREFRISGRLFLTYWLVITFHQGVALINSFFYPFISFNSDAFRFHEIAEVIGKSGSFHTWPNGSLIGEIEFFTNLLGFLYWIIHPSIFLGSQISILAFAISCIILIKILSLLEITRYKVSVLLAFGSLPSVVLMSSVPLRESYEVLFFMLAIYFGLKMNLKESVNGYGLFMYGIFMVASAFLMGLAHHGLLIYAEGLVVLFLVWTPSACSSLLAVKRRHFMLVLAVMSLLVSAVFLAKVKDFDMSVISKLINFKWESVMIFRDNSETTLARTTYVVSMNFSSILMGTKTIFMIYLNYLFAPFPWQVTTVLDCIASLESFLRLVFIYFSVKYWLSSNGQKRRVLGFMLILFLSMSFMFALGTTSYGTAIRHNMLSWWILAVTGTPLLIERLHNFLQYFSIRRSDTLGEAELTP
jgi:hypothetical protein